MRLWLPALGLLALVSSVVFPATSFALCPRLDSDVSPWVQVIHADADQPDARRLEYALLIYPKAELDQAFSQRFEFTPLSYAARVNANTAALESLLNATPTPQKPDSFLRTALHQAALCGNVTAVELFLKAGFEVDAVDGFGNTPFVYAMQSGEERTAVLLLAAGASIDVTPKEGSTLVALAARTGKPTVLAHLLAAGQSASGTDYRGNSALYYAAEHGDLRSVEALLAHGAKLDAESPETGLVPIDVTLNFEVLLALAAKGAKSKIGFDRFAQTCFVTGFPLERNDPICSGNATHGYNLFQSMKPETVTLLANAGVIRLAAPFKARKQPQGIDPYANYFEVRFVQTDLNADDEVVLKLILAAGFKADGSTVLWTYFSDRSRGYVDAGALKLAIKLGLVTSEILNAKCGNADCAVDTEFGEFSIPLFYYTAEGNAAMIQELIDAGADPKQVVTTVSGEVGLADYALMKGQHDLFQNYVFTRKLPIKNKAIMADFGDAFFAQSEVMFLGDLSTCFATGAKLAKFVALGADVNAEGVDGKLALSEALKRRDFCSAQKLVAMGGDLVKAKAALGQDPSVIVFNHILLRDTNMAKNKSEMLYQYSAAVFTMNQFFQGTECSPEFVAELEPSMELIETTLAWPRGNRNIFKAVFSKQYRKDKWQYLWKYRFVNLYRDRCAVK